MLTDREKLLVHLLQEAGAEGATEILEETAVPVAAAAAAGTRLRTITQAYREIRERDPATALTEGGLRRLVKIGEVPSLNVGRRRLINMDALEAYLASPQPAAKQETPRVGELRRIAFR